MNNKQIPITKRWLQKFYTCLLFLVSIYLMPVAGQQSIPAAGGNISGSEGMVSYSIGQAFYHCQSSESGKLVQGIQQPYEIFAITGMEEYANLDLFASLYPNPAKDYLILSFEGNSPGNYVVELYDMKGKKIKMLNLEGSRSEISLNELDAATYILKVIINQQEIKSFKIIKN